MARVRALLRRRGGGETDEVVEVSGIRLEHAARRVLVDGSEVTLANKEYELLRVLLEHAGQVVSRDAILDEVWGDATSVVRRPSTCTCRGCAGRSATRGPRGNDASRPCGASVSG